MGAARRVSRPAGKNKGDQAAGQKKGCNPPLFQLDRIALLGLQPVFTMRRLHLGLVLLLTAACQPVGQSGMGPTATVTGAAPPAQTAQKTVTVTETIVLMAPPPAPEAPAEPIKPAPPVQNDAARKVAVPEPAPAPEPTPLPTPAPVVLPVFDPADVMGQSPDALEHRLGSASVVRQEGQVQIWQYRLSACVADFFYYPAGDNDDLRLTAWDARSVVIGQTLDSRACRADLTARLRQMASN